MAFAPLEGAECAFELPEHQERFAQAGEGVFMLGVEGQRGIECRTRPGVLFARKLRVADADVELDRLRIAGEALPKVGECGIVSCFVVQLVGLLIEIIGAEKGLRHGRVASRWVGRNMGWEGGNCKSEKAGTARAKRRNSNGERAEQQRRKGGPAGEHASGAAVAVPPFCSCSSRLVAFAVPALFAVAVPALLPLPFPPLYY
jgi:hypothetical protein